MLGMRYSSNQNFDMVVMPQYYILSLSLVSILTALINSNRKLMVLAMVASITVVISFLTIVTSKTGIRLLGYPVGYYALCPMSLLLFLLQIKQITYFAWCKYSEVLTPKEQLQKMAMDKHTQLSKEISS